MSEGPDVCSGLASGPAPRYLLFGGTDYEESGGWNDLLRSADTVEELTAWWTEQFIRHVEAYKPGQWRTPWEVLATTHGSIIINGVASPSWADEAPDDAPPRPSEQHFWWPGRPERTQWRGIDWGHIVDLATLEVVKNWKRLDYGRGPTPGAWKDIEA